MEKWSDEDVQALLNIYAEDNIQKAFKSSARNAKVYQKISAHLSEMGIEHSPQRCREKMKKMKQDYKKIKDYNRVNGSKRRSGKWFERLDAILGKRGVRDDRFSELSFGSTAAHSRPTHCPPDQPHPPGSRAGKRKRSGDVLEVLRQLEEEQVEALRRDYQQRERHFQLLLQHIRAEFSMRQEEAANVRQQQAEFQKGVLTLLNQLVLSGRHAPSSSSPPLD